eukprot:TRINITY_DN16190_c0_g1_i1.p1 TRINITY_DN16190_c0_g1~~TRINITY_DN16190_c0_g1_i1.p1  ORF type:complete len:849 (-),score=188.56 TRINITY_DN16190_c0_g1_i1:432-2978(-)
MYSASMTMYSSSPPSSTFVSTTVTGFQPASVGQTRAGSSGGQTRAGADLDFSGRTPASKGHVKGGLTTLFAGQKSTKVVNLSSSVDSVESSLHFKRVSGSDFGSLGRDSPLGQSLPVSIPQNSRGKSPVSVLFGGSPVASLLSQEGNQGLPPRDRSHQADRQQRRSSGSLSEIKRRLLGGQEDDGTVILSRRSLADSPDSPPEFSLRAGLLDITLDLDQVDEESLASPSAQSLPAFLSPATLQRNTSMGRSFGLDSPDVRPQQASVFSPYPARREPKLQSPRPLKKLTAEEHLLKAQELHDLFKDSLVERAFRIAADAHEGRVRRNGELNIVHCLEAAKILAETTRDRVMVAAGLLHDVLDNTPTSEADLLRQIGPEVTALVAGVTKMGIISQIVRDTAGCSGSVNVDNLRTLMLAMSDPRAVIVKLADRLHNLRTLDALPPHKQLGIARETLDVFANLARRLGVWNIKTEMEDICFKYLMPVECGNLKAMLAEGYDLHESVEAAVREVDAALRAKGIGYLDLSGRPKNLYSIYSKMKQKGRNSLEDIYDVRGIRIIVTSVPDCYAALDVVQSLWSQIPSKFKDYIKSPKNNGYQSLHTVLRDRDGYPIEVQLRTEDMHVAAEYGVAAHWRYKESVAGGNKATYSSQVVAWARYIISFLVEASDNKVRVAGVDSRPPPTPCPFPEHEPNCGNAPLAAGLCLDGIDGAPVLIIERENDTLTVRELPAGTTAGDLVNERIKRGLPANASAALPVINDHEAESAAQRLHTGDVVEIVLTCPPPLVAPELVGEEGLLPLHVPNASQIQQLDDAVSVELKEKLRSMRSGEALSDGWVEVGAEQGVSRMQVARG